MNPVDPLTAIGGGSILALMGVVAVLLIRRYTAQDTGWRDIVTQLQADLANLRAECRADTARLQGELKVTRDELDVARLQLRELQHWEHPRDP